MKAILSALLGPPKTVNDVLEEYFQDGKTFGEGSKLNKFRVVRHASTYFVSHGRVNFRHQGRNDFAPKIVALMKQNKVANEAKVHVYLGASGAGKSIDLAGGAFIRDADLALV